MNDRISEVKFNNFDDKYTAYSLSDPLKKDKVKQSTQSAFVAYNANPDGYVSTPGNSVWTDTQNA